MAKKKVKTNFGEIENLHKNEMKALQTPEGLFFTPVGASKPITERDITEMLAVLDKESEETEKKRQMVLRIAAESYLPQRVAEGTGSLTSDPKFAEALKKWNETPWQFGNPSEAEWITQIRDYCKDNEVYPPHILQFYKEHHTEKAPD